MSDIVEVIPGLTLETLYDGRIEIWIASRTSKEITDCWYQNSAKTLENWQDIQQPYLTMLDMSRVVLTPYGREKAAAPSKVQPDIQGRVAVVIMASTMGHMTRLFVNNMPKTRQRRVFFSRGDAMLWLEEAL